MKLVIVDGEGQKTAVPFAGDEVTIGRGSENAVRLAEKDVSRRHCRIVREDGGLYVEDLGSLTGIRVNGEKVRGRRALHEGDTVQISAYALSLDAAADQPDEAQHRKLAETSPIRLSDLRAAGEGGPAQELGPLKPRRNTAAIAGAGVALVVALAAVAFQLGRGREVPAPAAVAAPPSPVQAASPVQVAPPPAAPAEAPLAHHVPSRARPEMNDDEASRLLSEGNQKLMAQDVEGALELFQRAISLKPPKSIAGGLYRGMGIAFTRQGNVEQGARYYRLYLPLCTDPGEKAQLQQVLDDYEARRR